MKYLKYLMPLTLAALLIITCMIIMYNTSNATIHALDEELPDIKLYSSTNQNDVSLHNLPDQTYLLNIFATWCNYCNREKPFLLQLQKKYNLPLYGILYMDDLTNVSNELRSNFRDILVENNGQLLSSIKCNSLPETLIIHNNRIVFRSHGSLNQSSLQKDLHQLLNSLKNVK